MTRPIEIPNWALGVVVTIILALLGVVYGTLDQRVNTKQSKEVASERYGVIIKSLAEIKHEQSEQGARLQDACENIARMNGRDGR